MTCADFGIIDVGYRYRTFSSSGFVSGEYVISGKDCMGNVWLQDVNNMDRMTVTTIGSLVECPFGTGCEFVNRDGYVVGQYGNRKR